MSGAGLGVCLLGPVEVCRGQVPVPLTRLEVAVVAALAATPGRKVSTESIIEFVWSASIPSSAANRVQALVSSIRRHFGADAAVLRTVRLGYLLDLDPQHVDATAFEMLVAAAHIDLLEGAHDRAARKYQQALALWRGRALESLRSLPAEMLASQWEELRLRALEDCAEALLHCGRSGDLIAVLMSTLAAHPTRARLRLLTMRALDANGRRAEAILSYHDAVAYFRDELGVDPDAELTTQYQRMLRNEAEPHERSAPRQGQQARLPTVPRYLPADTTVFCGRATELEQIMNAAAAPVCAPMIVAVTGPAGVGKTALAVHAAHRIAAQAVDGQLYLDLSGFTPGIEPVTPLEALNRLLRALGVSGDDIPAEVDLAAGMLRSRLAGKRMLLLLDNAADESQVQPLLPAAAGCVVLVTSRRRLSGLDNVVELPLEVMAEDEAIGLFRTASRTAAADEEQVREVVALCGRLPLAIRIAAARLRSRPAWTPAYLATRLRDEHHRLCELQSGQGGVRGALDVSYGQLGTAQQRLLRLLGLHPGSDIDVLAAAALADVPAAHADQWLEELTDVHLVHQRSAGRYALHDIVRIYARDRAQAQETESASKHALARIVEFYTRMSEHAAACAHPEENECAPVGDSPFLAPADALGWLETERLNVLAALRTAIANGWTSYPPRISVSMRTYLLDHAQHADSWEVHHAAIAAAATLADAVAEARARVALGKLYNYLDRYCEAMAESETVLRVAAQTRDPRSAGMAHANLAISHMLRGECADGLRHFLAAEPLSRAANDLVTLRAAISGLGLVARNLGDYVESRRQYERALDIAKTNGDWRGESHLLLCLGENLRLTGHLSEGIAALRQSMSVAVAHGDRARVVHTLLATADIHRDLTDDNAALGCYQRALELAREINEETAEREALIGIADIHERTGRHQEAAKEYQWALALARKVCDRKRQLEATLGLARIAAASGAAQEAAELSSQAAAISEAIDATIQKARTLNEPA